MAQISFHGGSAQRNITVGMYTFLGDPSLGSGICGSSHFKSEVALLLTVLIQLYFF